MPGLLSALNLARSGMAASQKSMEVVGNNVSNVNTEGYSRQSTQMEALPTVESGGLSFGQGVEVTGITREQNNFITDRLRAAGEQLGDAEAKASPLKDLERILNIGDDSLAGKVDDFFGSWQELALNPGSEVERGIVMRNAEVLGSKFNEVTTSLDKLRQSVDSTMSAKIEGVNAKLEQVASLNAKVQQAQAVGKAPNTALDQRDQLLQELSQSIGATAVEGKGGMASVHLPSGLTLVQDTNAYSLSTGESKDGVQQYTLERGDSSMALQRRDLGGEFGGLIDVRDEVVTKVQKEIDSLRTQLIQTVNAQHSQGTDLNGKTGENFFEPVTRWTSGNSFDTKDPDSLGGGDLTITMDDETEHDVEIDDDATLDEIKETINSSDAEAIATVVGTDDGEYTLQIASTNPGKTIKGISGDSLGFGGFDEQSGTGDTGLELAIGDPSEIAAGKSDAPGDNTNAQAIATLIDDKTVDGSYSYGDFYGKVAAEAGIVVQQNEFQRSSSEDTLDQLQNRRDEITGVSIDESMINLQRYQKSFQASAKYMTSVDEMMQTLLNIKR